jgi:hypothetical protein
MHPKHNGLTFTPVRPKLTYLMLPLIYKILQLRASFKLMDIIKLQMDYPDIKTKRSQVDIPSRDRFLISAKNTYLTQVVAFFVFTKSQNL